MLMRFDRNLLQWFDDFFQNQTTQMKLSNFTFEIRNLDRFGDMKSFRLTKDNGRYWSLEFVLPRDYVLKLEKNVHPIFHEYVDDNISIFADNSLYRFLNVNMIDVFNSIAEIGIDESTGSIYIDYSDFFLERCRGISMGEERQISGDKSLEILSGERVLIRNADCTFALFLSFSSAGGENILDSLIDLRKSVMIMER